MLQQEPKTVLQTKDLLKGDSNFISNKNSCIHWKKKNVETRLQHHGQMKKVPVKQEKKLHNKFQKTFERRNRATEKSVSTVYWVSTV